DLPHAWTPWIRTCLVAADEIVVVATPDLSSLRNAKNLIELLRHARPNDTPPRLVINQAGIPKRPEIPAKDFAETMGVEPSAVLPFDAAIFGQAGNNGQMVLEVAPKTPASDNLRRLARTLTGREAASGGGEKSANSILSFLKNRKRA
ncbi:MAG: pilus assembly protein CpaE, partial [Alphaproteobacteria bacterium]|nr:pilus assembly protein CpaE [Alphaproteobacteria bacterium]